MPLFGLLICILTCPLGNPQGQWPPWLLLAGFADFHSYNKWPLMTICHDHCQPYPVLHFNKNLDKLSRHSWWEHCLCSNVCSCFGFRNPSPSNSLWRISIWCLQNTEPGVGSFESRSKGSCAGLMHTKLTVPCPTLAFRLELFLTTLLPPYGQI